MEIKIKIDYKNARHARLCFLKDYYEDKFVEIYIEYMQEKNGEWETIDICDIHEDELNYAIKFLGKDPTNVLKEVTKILK